MNGKWSPLKKQAQGKMVKKHFEWKGSGPCAVGVRNVTAHSTHDSRGTAKERREVAAWNQTYNDMETRYGPSPEKRICLLEIEKRKMISESSFLSSNPLSSHLPSASTKPSSSSVNLDAAFFFSQESLASSQEPFTKYVANNLNVGKDKAMQSVTNQSKHQKK